MTSAPHSPKPQPSWPITALDLVIEALLISLLKPQQFQELLGVWDQWLFLNVDEILR